MGRRLRTTFLLGVLVGLALALLRALGREGRSAPASLAVPAPALPEPRPVPVARAEVPAVVAATTPDEAAPAAPAAATSDGAATWVAPDEGACPDGYPVKAKESSRIFHVPGGLSYDRTRPDRCYPDAVTAEADGFRPAKR